MTYVPGTVLTRREPFEKPAKGEPDERPYNEIVVVGSSVVTRNVRNAEWNGQLGDEVTVKPTSFGAVIDLTQGELQRDYEVKSIPEPRRIQRQEVIEVQPGPSPEEVFAAAAPGKPPAAPAAPDAPSPEDVFAGAAGDGD